MLLNIEGACTPHGGLVKAQVRDQWSWAGACASAPVTRFQILLVLVVPGPRIGWLRQPVMKERGTWGKMQLGGKTQRKRQAAWRSEHRGARRKRAVSHGTKSRKKFPQLGVMYKTDVALDNS